MVSPKAFKQSYGGVQIIYGEDQVLTPLEDYVELLDHVSSRVPKNSPQFTSRVGLARIALLAGALGVVFGVHVVLLFGRFDFASPLTNWCIYALAMCIYHWSEFLITARNHPHTLSFDSFLVNQSFAFGIAIVASWVEFGIEILLAPQIKSSVFLSSLGLVVVIIGQIFRSLAMYQAGPSFTHLIEHEKKPRHVLITTGVYRYLPHPGYFGWFYWSIGTQLLLGNPVCVIAYAFVAHRFFKDRIPVEEEALLHIFGDEYANYRRRTWIGIPGIRSISA